MILLEGYIDRGFDIDTVVARDRDEERTLRATAPLEDTVLVGGRRVWADEAPERDEL